MFYKYLQLIITFHPVLLQTLFDIHDTSSDHYCEDPDTKLKYPINSTWYSTTFCGNYTCRQTIDMAPDLMSTPAYQQAIESDYNSAPRDSFSSIKKSLTGALLTEPPMYYSSQLLETDIPSLSTKFEQFTDTPTTPPTWHTDSSTNSLVTTPMSTLMYTTSTTSTFDDHTDTRLYDIFQELSDVIRKILGEQNNFDLDENNHLTEQEIAHLTKLAYKVKKGDLKSVQQVLDLANEIFSEVNETAYHAPCDKCNVKTTSYPTTYQPVHYVYPLVLTQADMKNGQIPLTFKNFDILKTNILNLPLNEKLLKDPPKLALHPRLKKKQYFNMGRGNLEIENKRSPQYRVDYHLQNSKLEHKEPPLYLMNYKQIPNFERRLPQYEVNQYHQIKPGHNIKSTLDTSKHINKPLLWYNTYNKGFNRDLNIPAHWANLRDSAELREETIYSWPFPQGVVGQPKNDRNIINDFNENVSIVPKIIKGSFLKPKFEDIIDEKLKWNIKDKRKVDQNFSPHKKEFVELYPKNISLLSNDESNKKTKYTPRMNDKQSGMIQSRQDHFSTEADANSENNRNILGHNPVTYDVLQAPSDDNLHVTVPLELKVAFRKLPITFEGKLQTKLHEKMVTTERTQSYTRQSPKIIPRSSNIETEYKIGMNKMLLSNLKKLAIERAASKDSTRGDGKSFKPALKSIEVHRSTSITRPLKSYNSPAFSASKKVADSSYSSITPQPPDASSSESSGQKKKRSVQLYLGRIECPLSMDTVGVYGVTEEAKNLPFPLCCPRLLA